MRKSVEKSLKEVIENLIDDYSLRDKLNDVRVKEAWQALMGEPIVNRTLDIRMRNDVLEIRLSSAPLRDELQYSKQQLITSLNEELGGNVIKDIKLA